MGILPQVKLKFADSHDFALDGAGRAAHVRSVKVATGRFDRVSPDGRVCCVASRKLPGQPGRTDICRRNRKTNTGRWSAARAVRRPAGLPPVDSGRNAVHRWPINIYGYRWYDPLTGRWPSRDPIGERAKGAGEPSQYYGGPASNNPSENVADATGLSGPGIQSIINRVTSDICKDFCRDRSIKINLFGWSRGAIAAVEIAKKLKDVGCTCDHPGGVVRQRICYVDKNGEEKFGIFESIVASWAEIVKPVSVNFLGLYDAVEMVPNSGWSDLATAVPDNVVNFFHATKHPKFSVMFPTQNLGDESQQVPFGTNGGPSSHGDIGTNPNQGAHRDMILRAAAAGVKMW